MNLSRKYPAHRCGSCGRLMHFALDAAHCVECDARTRIDQKHDMDGVRNVPKAAMSFGPPRVQWESR